MKNIFFLLFAGIILTSMTTIAQIPQKISYQGLLTTSSGKPVQDGSYNLKFDFYNLPNAGILRHTETHNAVEVERGAFSVILGPLPAIFSESLYVEVTALSGPGISGSLTFSPRSELTCSPYSLAPWTPVDSNIYFNGGNVGIGTPNPTTPLYVKASIGPSGDGVVTIANNGTDGNGLVVRANNGPDAWAIYTQASGGGFGGYFEGRGYFSGNVGIGTVNPGQKLTVAGTIESTSGGIKFPDGSIQTTAIVINHYIGEFYGGGVVFYVDQTGEHGLICSLGDQSYSQVWSNLSTTLIGSTAQSDWNGQGNTTAIISQSGHATSAAKLCDDYTSGSYSDWFLPTLQQLNKLYNSIYEVNKTLEDNGYSYSVIDKDYYWSSTENGASTAWTFDMRLGSPYNSNKNANVFRTRAVRDF